MASKNARVAVESAGRSVAVEPNTQTELAPGAAPTSPAQIPADVFLKVAWPRDPLAGTTAVLRGTATPGTRVVIGGRAQPVGADGVFEVSVPVLPGGNRVTVVAETVDGRQTESEGEITVTVPGSP